MSLTVIIVCIYIYIVSIATLISTIWLVKNQCLLQHNMMYYFVIISWWDFMHIKLLQYKLRCIIMWFVNNCRYIFYDN